MCGITGALWTAAEVAVSKDELRRMSDALTHRGPDAQGQYWHQGSSVGVALGHRRLSIIDLQQGQQPMSNEDGSIQLVFNGEIYNYRELRKSLLAQGVQFRTASDTEVLLRLYEQKQEKCLDELRGMFAFAIWDQRNNRLFLARDRIGQKPLVYRKESNRILFASELKSLLQIQNIPRKINHKAIDLFLTYQYVPHPYSILEGFEKLPPAHYAVWENGNLKLQRYWSAPFSLEEQESGPGLLSYKDQVEQLRQLLSDAVRLRLRSDVPLGAFLSGGIDSTVITGLMQREMSRPVETFSIGFDVAQYDETSYAREAAKKLGTNHHEHIVSPSALDSLPKLIWHYDEPFADSSAIPTMALCEVTGQSVKVAITGDGGDELFAGYDRYRAVRLGERIDSLPFFLRRLISSSFWQKLPASIGQKSFFRRLKRFLGSASLEPRHRYLQWIAIFQEVQRAELYTTGFQNSLQEFQAEQWLGDVYQQFPDRDFVTRTTAVDLVSYLPCDILTKVDIASMSVGLECRSPFLDHKIAEFTSQLPLNFKLKGKIGKRILRDAFSELIPESILTRPKMGFGVPVDHWFRNELKPMLHDILLSERSLSRGYFSPDAVRNLVEEHIGSRVDHSSRLWALLVLESWQRMFLDPAVVPTQAPSV